MPPTNIGEYLTIFNCVRKISVAVIYAGKPCESNPFMNIPKRGGLRESASQIYNEKCKIGTFWYLVLAVRLPFGPLDHLGPLNPLGCPL